MGFTNKFSIFVKVVLAIKFLITEYVKQKAVREQRISFEITADPFYSATNMERLEKAVKDI